MRRLIAVWLMIFATGAAWAQSDMDDFKQVLDKFIGEQRIFLNCTAPDSLSYGIVLRTYQEMVEATHSLLDTYGTPADRADFEAKTALDVMLMRDHKFGEVIDLCNQHPGWQNALYHSKFIILQHEASRIFYDRHHPGERQK
jgi:hypothetical protein